MNLVKSYYRAEALFNRPWHMELDTVTEQYFSSKIPALRALSQTSSIFLTSAVLVSRTGAVKHLLNTPALSDSTFTEKMYRKFTIFLRVILHD